MGVQAGISLMHNPVNTLRQEHTEGTTFKSLCSFAQNDLRTRFTCPTLTNSVTQKEHIKFF